MKTILKKFLICILILLILNNFFMGSISNAAETKFFDILEGVFGTIVGLLTLIPRLVAVAIAAGVDLLAAQIAYIEGGQNGVTTAPAQLTPFDMLFNKIQLTDINFFDFNCKSATIKAIRQSVAGWYYIMRTFACGILLVVLIYVGIRMALSTIASDKAMYKKMLVDWICSMALIFVIQYIVLFTINLNDVFVKGLSNITDGEQLNKAIKEIRGDVFRVSLKGLTATVVYCMLVAQTIGLLISYINRMIKIGFLIIISPLITLTYSLDKMGDGKAQALGNWLREYIFTVLIQPFHCVIYMVFVSMTFKILNSGDDPNSFAGAILCMVSIRFTKEAEKIIRTIFSFKDDNSSTSVGAGMAASAMLLSKSKEIGKATVSGVSKAQNAIAAGRNAFADAAITYSATTAMFRDKKEGNEDASQKSFADYKQEARDSRDVAALEKQERKALAAENNKKLSSKFTGKGDVAKEINKTASEIKANNPGMKDKEAQNLARREYAKNHSVQEKSTEMAKRITDAKPTGTVRKALHGIGSMETVKVVKDIAKNQIMAGVGFYAGSTMLGTGSNFIQAATVGAAATAATKEAFSKSGGRLTKDAAERLNALGYGDKAGAQDALNTIASKGDSGQYDNSKAAEILDEVKNELAKMGYNEADRTRIASSIRNNITSNSMKNSDMSTHDLVNGALTKAAQNGLITDEQKETLKGSESIENMAIFAQEKNIYDDISKSQDIGLSYGAFVAGASGKAGRGFVEVLGKGGTTDGTTQADDDGNGPQQEPGSDVPPVNNGAEAQEGQEETSQENGTYDMEAGEEEIDTEKLLAEIEAYDLAFAAMKAAEVAYDEVSGVSENIDTAKIDEARRNLYKERDAVITELNEHARNLEKAIESKLASIESDLESGKTDIEAKFKELTLLDQKLTDMNNAVQSTTTLSYTITGTTDKDLQQTVARLASREHDLLDKMSDVEKLKY